MDRQAGERVGMGWTIGRRSDEQAVGDGQQAGRWSGMDKQASGQVN